MLGHRGCRLGITYPGDLRDAGARDLRGGLRRRRRERRDGRCPEIMIPLVAHAARSWRSCATLVDDTARDGVRRAGRRTLDYLVGTMIELPRAALMAGEIAEDAEFFSLRHQRPDADHLRLSRDDAGALPARLRRARASIERDPFVSLDQRRRRRAGRASPSSAAGATRPDLKLGICGEHGGDPASIAFCDERRASTTSRCSPYRVPIARLAAAQAALAAPEAKRLSAKHHKPRRADGRRQRRLIEASRRRPAAERVSIGKAVSRSAMPAPAARPAPKKSAGKRGARPAAARSSRKPVGKAPRKPPTKPRGGKGKRRRWSADAPGQAQDAAQVDEIVGPGAHRPESGRGRASRPRR